MLNKIRNKMNFIIYFIYEIITYIFRYFPVISPTSRFKLAWDLLLMLAISFLLLVVPIHIGFNIPFREFTY